MGALASSNKGPTSCRRWNGRAALAIPAKLSLPDGDVRCVLDDLSLGGARLTVEQVPKCGSLAFLKFEDYMIFASVLWVQGKQCGLLFEERLAKSDLLHMLADARRVAEYEDSRTRDQAQAWVTGGH